MKIKKRFLLVLLALAMVFSMVACGDSDKTKKKDDDDDSSKTTETTETYLGKYLGVSVNILDEDTPMSEVYEGENYIELKVGNKCVFMLDGDRINCSYTIEGENLTISIEGVEYKATVKDGVLLLDFMSIAMTFTKDGKAPSSNSGTADKDSIVGYYKITELVVEGEAMGSDMLAAIGMDGCYILFNEDGTGRIRFDNESEFTYDDKNLTVDGDAQPYTFEDGKVTIELEGTKMVFSLSDETPPEPGAGSAISEDVVDAFEGDWHGMAMISEGEGKYETNVGLEFEIIARFVFDSEGITPYIGFALNDGEIVENLVFTYDDVFEEFAIEGELIGCEITEDSYIMEDGGAIYISLVLDDGEGNTATIFSCLRHLDAEWNYDEDYPYMNEDMLAFYNGKDFEEIAGLFGLDVDEIPAA